MIDNIADITPLTIISVSDPKYLKCLKVLTASVNQNSPTTKLYYHLINYCDDEAVSKELLNIHPFIEFSFEKKQFQTDEQKRAYCANIRGEIISKLLACGRKLLLYLDSDSIVRKDLSELEALMKTHDILILKRAEIQDTRLRFLTSTIGLNNTDATRHFVQRWAEIINKNIYEWWTDQTSFADTYDELSSAINLRSIPQKFVDSQFSIFSPIWTGKGEKKYGAELYLLEEQYYIKKIKGEETLSILFRMGSKRLLKYFRKLPKRLLERSISAS